MYYLHYDMDAFFASIEIRDNKNLENKAVAVGEGVITTCNYIAREKGVKSAMNVVDAKKLCPNLICLTPRVPYYFSVGDEIQEYISSFFEETNFVSCDEGFVNISKYVKKQEDILKICKKLKKLIYNKFKLTLSIGVGTNKSMAKIATDINKPNGIYIFYNKEQFLEYIKEKDVKIFPGIGPKTREILNIYGINKTKDFFYKSKTELIEILGESRGQKIYDLVRGNGAYMYEERENINYSVAREHTYNIALNSLEEIKYNFEKIVDEIEYEIKSKNLFPKTITIKIKTTSFNSITKSKTFDAPITEKEQIIKTVNYLLENSNIEKDVRLLGIFISNFVKDKYEYIKLF